MRTKHCSIDMVTLEGTLGLCWLKNGRMFAAIKFKVDLGILVIFGRFEILINLLIHFFIICSPSGKRPSVPLGQIYKV